MAESDSQATVVYSYSRPTASSRRGSDKTYCASNKSDRDTSGYSDISDSELSQACDVVLGQTDGFADRYILHFSDISDTELTAASQAVEDSCVKESTARFFIFPFALQSE